jgi:uncharacterized protein YbjT (DUF2867 family)
MSSGPDARPLLVVVGGCGGLVGRALLEEFRPTHRIRSVHRRESPNERSPGVEWVPADASRVEEWRPILEGADTVLSTAWYRQATERRFVDLASGLRRLVAASDDLGVRRFVHVSVPPAPERLERDLPYLREKRTVDAAVQGSSLAYAIVRPTMLFGPRDRLLTVMQRLAYRYHRLPLFGDGEYHLSPLAVDDFARIVRREGERGGRAVTTVGGPERFRYRDLVDLLFASLGRAPQYLRFTPRGGVRLARLLEALGSSLIYAYEVEWLLADLLGVPPYEGLEAPLRKVGPFVAEEARRLRERRRVSPPSSPRAVPPS